MWPGNYDPLDSMDRWMKRQYELSKLAEEEIKAERIHRDVISTLDHSERMRLQEKKERIEREIENGKREVPPGYPLKNRWDFV